MGYLLVHRYGCRNLGCCSSQARSSKTSIYHYNTLREIIEMITEEILEENYYFCQNNSKIFIDEDEDEDERSETFLCELCFHLIQTNVTELIQHKRCDECVNEKYEEYLGSFNDFLSEYYKSGDESHGDEYIVYRMKESDPYICTLRDHDYF